MTYRQIVTHIKPHTISTSYSPNNGCKPYKRLKIYCIQIHLLDVCMRMRKFCWDYFDWWNASNCLTLVQYLSNNWCVHSRTLRCTINAAIRCGRLFLSKQQLIFILKYIYILILITTKRLYSSLLLITFVVILLTWFCSCAVQSADVSESTWVLAYVIDSSCPSGWSDLSYDTTYKGRLIKGWNSPANLGNPIGIGIPNNEMPCTRIQVGLCAFIWWYSENPLLRN